jgi:hypothetical protein
VVNAKARAKTTAMFFMICPPFLGDNLASSIDKLAWPSSAPPLFVRLFDLYVCTGGRDCAARRFHCPIAAGTPEAHVDRQSKPISHLRLEKSPS